MNKIAKFFKISEEEFFKDCLSKSDTIKLKDLRSLELPKRATVGSCGYDFHLPIDIEVLPGKSITIPTLVRCKIAEGWMLMIVPRSGLGTKYRCRLDNTVGIIDSDYYNSDNEGHIFVKFTNEGDKVLTLKKGDRFCQGIFLPFGITEDDDCDGQRNGGFGSTNN